MKYLSTILTLIFLNSILIFSLIFFGKKSELIYKENSKISFQIKEYSEQLKINEVEYNFLNQYSNLIKLQKIYMDFENEINNNNRITLNDFKNKNVENFYRVSSN